MSATGERDGDDDPVVNIRHPEPCLGTYETDDGGGVLYDDEYPDCWMEADESHYLELDGRWR